MAPLSDGHRTRRIAIGLLLLLFLLTAVEAWGLTMATTDPHGLGNAPSILVTGADRIEPLYGGVWMPDASLDWSPDGRRIALGGGFSGGVAIVDPLTGRPLQGWDVPGYVHVVRWSPDGRWLAVGADKGFDGPGWVFLYSPTGSVERSWQAHSRSIGDLAWSPNGSWIATTANVEYAIWEGRTGTRLRFDGNASALGFSLSWSPDGRRLAFGDVRGGPSIYDALTGARIREADYASFLSASVAWSPRGNRIAAGLGNGWLRLVDADGALVADLHAIDHRGAYFEGTSVSWSRDGSLVALAASEGVALVSVDTVSVVRLLVFPVAKFRSESGAVRASGDVYEGDPLDRVVAWSPRGNALAVTATTTHPSFRVWGVRNTPMAAPLVVLGLSWIAALGLLFRDDLRQILRTPERAATRWLQIDPALSAGVPLIAFGVVSSLLLAWMEHAVGRIHGLQAMPSLGWFALNGLLSVPLVLVSAVVAVKAFHGATWPAGHPRPFRRRSFRAFGLVLLPFVWTAGTIPILFGAAFLSRVPLAVVDPLVARPVGMGVLLGFGFYLAGRTARGFPEVQPVQAWWGLVASAFVSVAAFFTLAIVFWAFLNILQVAPVGEFATFGFQLLFAFGFTPMLVVVIAIATGAVAAGVPQLARLLLGGYARARGKDVLALEARRTILGLVESNPGIHFRELLRRSRLGSGTLHYHLSVLEREGFLISRRDAGRRRFFPADAQPR